MAEQRRSARRSGRRRGQPLVFLLTVIGVWSAARLVHHWPVDPAPDAPAAELPVAAGKAVTAASRSAWSHAPRVRRDSSAEARPAGRLAGAPLVRNTLLPYAAALAHQQMWLEAMLGAPGGVDAEATPAAPIRDGPLLPPSFGAPDPAGLPVSQPAARRWAVYAWSLVRQGRGTRPLAPVAQYGGNQAGLLVQYTLGDRRYRPMIYARATSALATGDDRTVAMGVSARPFAAWPLDLAVERRIALSEGQRDRFAVMALASGAGSLGRSGFQLEGYGQAGLVGLSDPLGFFDLQMLATRSVHRTDHVSLTLGGGLWAGGQQNADGTGGKLWVHRVDIGPRAAVTLPVDNGSLALALDWRQRVDGDARPHSGPALTLSAGF